MKTKPQPLLKAFKHAFDGLFFFFRHDRNGRIHIAAAAVVSLAGWWFRINATEWCILLLCMMVVIGFEMCNHALENLCNVVHADLHPFIKTVKDVAAAAVLFSAIASVIVGLLIFIPKLGIV